VQLHAQLKNVVLVNIFKLISLLFVFVFVNPSPKLPTPFLVPVVAPSPPTTNDIPIIFSSPTAAPTP
jgi:hypothetical protein